ncbi:unnamed protein product [Caenorhabditis angaria]|uniref:F-box domain-containing protein n=1 Tax=Caenorhabditis angaria TaxID=860376 RepID=A0A9P1IDU1_9PELO|nr:unnamed protein product [Caenorhabditis angaria]
MGAYFSKWNNSGEIGWFDLPFDMRRSIIDLMDFESKSRFAKCSIDCSKEVSETRNFIEKIVIVDGREGNSRIIQIFVTGNGKDNKKYWLFKISELSSGNIEVCWEMNNEIISRKIFKNSNPIDIVLMYFNDILKKNSKSLKFIGVVIDDFPYNQTNIKNLKCNDMISLSIVENKYGIDPVLSGFVDFDTMCRFIGIVEIPNCPLEYIFKIESATRVLTNPIISLDEFDNYLRRFLIDEEFGRNFKRIELNIEKYEENFDDFHKIIRKYMDSGEIKGYERTKPWFYMRESTKWEHQTHLLFWNKTNFRFLTRYRSITVRV